MLFILFSKLKYKKVKTMAAKKKAKKAAKKAKSKKKK
jgi:hypothetical protein